jgi:ferritin-like metal-binding protein YciE
MKATELTTANSKLESFFNTMLQEIYWSETQLVNVLTTMRDASTTATLKDCFSTHIKQTNTHIKRLQEVFTLLNQPAQAEPSVGLQGLFDEGWQVIDETEEGSAQRDVALIIAAQKVEHYEIACYGSLATLARTLGWKQIAKVLEVTLSEEKETDSLLTEIAKKNINYQASKEPVEEL